jgi:hypothetical protein
LFSSNRLKKKYFETIETINKMAQKQNLTEQERLELAAKLDNDLETFISSLEKRRPSEKIPIDQWEKVS